MREIEFRIWNGKEMNISSKKIEMKNATFYTINAFDDREDNENFILMQYTGLKDKKGIKIFEGDILKEYGKQDWNSATKDWSCLSIVKFNKGAFFSSNKNLGDWWLGGLITEKIEVVGNIYENPELNIYKK